MKHSRSGRAGPWRPALVVCAVVAVWLAPSAVARTAPEDVRITVTMSCASDEQAPFFQAEGAIVDSGSVEFVFLGPVAGQYGLTGHTIKSEALLIGNRGTLKLRWDVLFKPSDDPNIPREFGQWHVLEGTGAYAGLAGRGRSSGFCDLRGGPASEVQVLEGGVQ